MHANIQKQVMKAPSLESSSHNQSSHLISPVNTGALHGAEKSLSIPRALFKKRERESDRNEVLYLKQASFFINEWLF